MTEDVEKDILDTENVVRGICTPYHFDKKKQRLKKNAFKQKDPTRGVSVYRTLILPSAACKARAKLLSSGDKQYFGLARVQAGAVRETKAAILDSREDMFYGHADIFVITAADEYVHEEGEPLPPQIAELVDARIEYILNATTFFQDPQPEIEEWHGPDLVDV